MRLDDLPRLNDEERDALDDGYIAIEGVPTFEPPRRRRFALARMLAAVVGALALTACSMTPAQKKWAGFAAGVLVVGAIAAHQSDSGSSPPLAIADPNPPCRPQPDGSCR